MVLVKSKDAAETLNVSQTTVKRWASHFHNYFQKDRLGHYVFTQQDLAMLGYIKEALERGDTMDMIVLPESEPESEPAQLQAAELQTANGPGQQIAAANESSSELSEIYFRLEQVEYKVEQKADEVVTTQLLQHRSELEELRRLIDHLATAIENAKQPIPMPGKAHAAGTAAAEVAAASAAPDFAAPAFPAPASTRKRSLFRSLFVWF
ncbi:hypothetical protein DL346_21510 [Paenibacillus montanisoli]|uniref:HTH merR-type domain-containing protein n=1 Tax=Paenibacillus montanisoli TaxID=2081970 RepID=A0A328U3R6_9BACL|nr:MerR family transcriptional regulator [Paenibacillus montanisoli]RAP74634.1 hypothetical protein DL346_21510 [Paenibacillus montanisoli]